MRLRAWDGHRCHRLRCRRLTNAGHTHNTVSTPAAISSDNTANATRSSSGKPGTHDAKPVSKHRAARVRWRTSRPVGRAITRRAPIELNDADPQG